HLEPFLPKLIAALIGERAGMLPEEVEVAVQRFQDEPGGGTLEEVPILYEKQVLAIPAERLVNRSPVQEAGVDAVRVDDLVGFADRPLTHLSAFFVDHGLIGID